MEIHVPTCLQHTTRLKYKKKNDIHMHHACKTLMPTTATKSTIQNNLSELKGYHKKKGTFFFVAVTQTS